MMVEVPADPRLHQFIGGHAVTLDELSAHYASLAAGSRSPTRCGATGSFGAALKGSRSAPSWPHCSHDQQWTAHVVWVIGAPWQYQGRRSEAAQVLASWFGNHGVGDIVAHIHPDHVASMRVASRAGLQPTNDQVEGEQVWRAIHQRT